LLDEMDVTDVYALPSLPVERFELPRPSVDVMRARVEEIYDVDGIGVDTVTLRGWIAVKHDNPRPAVGQTEVSWNTAITPTEFVGLDLQGESRTFGTVHVRLDPSRHSLGAVGVTVRIPELADSTTCSSAPSPRPISTPDTGTFAVPKPTPKPRPKPAAGACCRADLAVVVTMPQLHLAMTTERPVLMYSFVETIPPVGYTATISLTPTRLVMSGRQVGTLRHAEVKFRELVRRVPLEGSTD
jgi:hypothetical protein